MADITADVRRDIIVVGASAGGVEALLTIARGLPADYAAAVFVVLHTAPNRRSHLPMILSRAGALPAAHAMPGEPIGPGRIYVAPPNRHLLLRDGYVELSHGPRENRSRPAIDPLFRSAARAYGPRVAGVVLSGALDDGAMGLAAIAARGGVTIVQDPDEALFGSMPRSAQRHARVDHTVPVSQIPALLTRLASVPATMKGAARVSANDPDQPGAIQRDLAAQADDARHNETSTYTCPECGGTLWQIEHDGALQFNCHVGHTFGPQTLLGQMSEELESALWTCVRMFTEKATLTRQLAKRMLDRGHVEQAARIEEHARADEQRADLIRRSLLETSPSSGDQTLVVAHEIDDAWEPRQQPRTEHG